MAKFEWKGDEEMRLALERSVAKFPGICQAMLRSAAQYLLFELKMAKRHVPEVLESVCAETEQDWLDGEHIAQG